MSQPKYLHFDVHPSVVFELGEDLISDDVQALAELVKNCYDADADWAVVRIDTDGSPQMHPTDVGYIEIEDNGTGMGIDVLQHGWLTISNSPKRSMKARGETTRKGRTPLGDKGVGRLGAQRVVNRLTISTTPVGSEVSHELSFDWPTLEDYGALSEVKVNL